MTGEAVRYAYETLKDNEIRTLSLLPGLPGTELRCVIRHAKFSPPRIYPNNLRSDASSEKRGESEDGFSEDELSEDEPLEDGTWIITSIALAMFVWNRE